MVKSFYSKEDLSEIGDGLCGGRQPKQMVRRTPSPRPGMGHKLTFQPISLFTLSFQSTQLGKIIRALSNKFPLILLTTEKRFFLCFAKCMNAKWPVSGEIITTRVRKRSCAVPNWLINHRRCQK